MIPFHAENSAVFYIYRGMKSNQFTNQNQIQSTMNRIKMFKLKQIHVLYVQMHLLLLYA